MIGGQAGISGHLNIGNNVKIGGGSGVIKDIPDNEELWDIQKDLKEFIRRINKKEFKFMIHKTAIVDIKAKISGNAIIGPYSIIGPNVQIGEVQKFNLTLI